VEYKYDHFVDDDEWTWIGIVSSIVCLGALSAAYMNRSKKKHEFD